MSGLMYGATNSGGAGAGDREKPDLQMDNAAENSFCSWFKSMPPKPEGTVQLFDRQDFYSAHGPDALLVASTVFKTHSVLKYLGGGKGGGLPSCTLSVAAAKSFLRDALTAQQMRVEIWSNSGGKRNNNWTMSKQASPGNLQDVEDLLFVNSDIVSSPIVVALKLRVQDGLKTMGAAFADATNRELGVAEFVDNDLFSNTESFLIQLGVKECLVPADDKAADYDLNKLRAVIERCNAIVTERKKADFTPKSIEQDINRLLKESAAGSALPELDMKTAMGSTSALLAYLGLLNDEYNFGQYTIRTHDLSQYLRLDNSALRALSLFPEPGQTGSNKNMSIFGLLNRCKTAQGVRMLGQWLKQPLVNVHAIEKRQNLVEVFAEDASTRQMLQTDHLKLMPDLHRISKRFQKGATQNASGQLEDVVRVYQAILKVPDLIRVLADAEVPSDEHRRLVDETYVQPLKELEGSLGKLVEMVEATLDLDELTNHNFVIKPDFNDRLRNIKERLDEVRDNLDDQHAKAGRDLGMELNKKLHLENHSTYGYCLRVTRNDAGAVRNKKNYTDIATIKGGLYFTTSVLRELNDDYRQLTDQYNSAQSGLVKDVIGIAASYCPPLEELNVVLAHLDVVVSFAHVSVSAPIPYVKPRVSEKASGGDLRISEVRHPCLEVQEDINFIPNDTEMVGSESEFLVITGPNMGGKSTYIRQVGIVALMAQAGCFVPAAEGAQVPVFDCILARVGAGDSQLKGVSTFMAEMLETATILKTATKDSLIIIDELGRGTSTYDGFGLAWAISEWIATKIHCKCLFATHFHELTALATQQSHVKNLHVVAHVEQRAGGDKQDRNITLLYKVEPGVSDQSYGIHVAELAHFPESVIRLAKRKAEELEDFDGEDEEPPTLSMSKEVTDEGTALVEEFMRTWAQRSASTAGTQSQEDDEADTTGEGGARKKRRMDPQTELEELRKCVEEFRPRMQANPWAAKVLESF